MSVDEAVVAFIYVNLFNKRQETNFFQAKTFDVKPDTLTFAELKGSVGISDDAMVLFPYIKNSSTAPSLKC